MRRIGGWVAAFFVLGLSVAQAAAPTQTLQKNDRGVDLRLKTGTLSLRFLTDVAVHVTFSSRLDFSRRPSLVRVGEASSVQWDLQEGPSSLILKTSRLLVEVERGDGRVTFKDPSGRVLLSEAGRSLEPVEVQGEKTFHVRQRWVPQEDESLYGLGQHQQGILDLKGYDLEFYQHNTEVFIPFLVSSKGYGILWDNTSLTRFGDLGDFTPIPSECLFDKTGKAGGLTRTTPDAAYPATQTADLDDRFAPPSKDRRPPDTLFEGFVSTPRTGEVQFRCFHGGEVRVWLDGRLLMDHLKRWLPGQEQAKVRLEAGRRYTLKIERKTQEGSLFRFLWKPPAPQETLSLWSEVGDGVDYTFFYGPRLDDVVAGYRKVTGRAPLPPAWAFGLWQSRQRYEKAAESVEVVEGFRKRGIPLDNIVQDWRYWREGEWGSHDFDPARFPDPEGWIQKLHELNTHVMIAVWGKYYPGTANFNELQKAGGLYQPNLEKGVTDWLHHPFTYYDAFNPKARGLFWAQIERGLFRRGIDAWWMDATEPEMTSESTVDDLRAHMHPTAMGTGARMLNAYPLLNSQGIWEGQRSSSPLRRPFILTRSGFAGQQRYGAAVWSGDVTSEWTTLAKQVPAGLGFCLSGLPYWTSDIGGYMMPSRFFPWQCKKEDEEEWRELNVRWFQFGTFCPLLRVHGEMRKREMWELGGEGHPAYQTCLAFDRLRYRLVPYIYSLAADVTFQGGTMMRPLVMDFPDDQVARVLTDEYLFGPAILVAPVTRYRARKREIYLPSGAAWYDFWTGKKAPSGKAFEAPAPLERVPLYVRAGSILPVGPERQFIAEKPSDPITLYIYQGADGDFLFYEDDGLTNDYEKGVFAVIPLHWDDEARVLTLGERRGSFPGMLEKREFRPIVVGPKSAAGFSFEPKSTRRIPYEGLAVTIGL